MSVVEVLIFFNNRLLHLYTAYFDEFRRFFYCPALNPTLPSLRYFSLYNSKLVICVFMFVYYKLFRF